jgi:hypothetical protein
MSIPVGTKFIGISPNVNMTERKSAQANSPSEVYTIEDIKDGGVPDSRTITINGTTSDLTANRTYTVTDANLSTSDITTNNVSTSKHGFAPKAPNDTSQYLRGDGNWASIPTTTGVWGISNTSGVYTFYSTLTLAMAAATSGQTIELFADVIETGAVTITLKNGVNFNFNGHTYTLNNANTVNALQDNGVAVNCTIFNGSILRTGGAGYALSVTGASLIRGDKFNLLGATGGQYNCLSINNANAAVYNMFCRNSAGFGTIILAGSLYDSVCIGVNGVGLYTTGLVSNCTASGFGAQSLQIAAGGRAIKCIAYNGTVAIENSGIAIDCVAYNTIGIAMNIQGGSTSLNCSAFSTASTGLSSNGNGTIENCRGFSTAGVGIGMINGRIDSCIAYSATSNAITTTNSGGITSQIVNSHAISVAAAAISAANANAGSTIHKTMVECYWPNAGGHAVVTSSAGANLEVIQCFLRTNNTSANAINSTVAKTVNYSQNAYKGMTTPINANITQGITNTEDNQGNILI